MNPNPHAIEFDNVSKHFGGTPAIDDVSFRVPTGVVFALLGENGAGKTTSIKSMLGMVRPDSGIVRVLGLDPIADATSLRHRIGFVPEQPSLYDWMKVDEIGWFAAGFHAPGFHQRYRRAIEAFRIDGHKKIRSLSKGMRAKVSLALAISHNPELLILDEPTSGLDPMVRREFLESMIQRAAVGQTVFLSSHQIGEVERVAEIVGIMRGGKLIRVQSLQTLKNETRELLINVTEPGIPVPLDGGNVITSVRTGRQWRLLVRDVSDQQLQHVRSNPFVQRLVVHEPSLEEIFVGYMTGDLLHQPSDRAMDERSDRARDDELINSVSATTLTDSDDGEERS